MADYEALKAKLLDIAEVLAKFPPALQPQVFDLLTDQQAAGERSPGAPPGRPKEKAAKPTRGAVDEQKKAPKRTKETVGLLKDLNLRGGKDIPSLKDFVTQKAPRSNIEFTAVAVYYLNKLLGLSGVTISHVNTCYKEVGQRPPGSFKQNLWDASSNKYGYIDASNMDDIAVPLRGETFVEHDLPHTAKGK